MERNNLAIYSQGADEWWKEGGTFSPLSGFVEPRFEYFDGHILEWKGLSVLDVGCGGGFMSETMAKRGCVVTGIDQSAPTVEVARKHAQESGLKIDYNHGVAEKLPFEAESFDAVVCVDVLEHLADLEAGISEMHRVLKPGGFFLFDTINRTFKSKFVMIWMLEVLLREIPRGAHDWKKFIRPQELTDIMSATGFGGIEIKGFDMKGKDKETGGYKVLINENTSVTYIGKGVKPGRQH